jgi:hypothetical protein
MKIDKSVKEILLENGYLVTEKCFGNWDRGRRMITDLKGKQIGFYRPLEAIQELTIKNK